MKITVFVNSLGLGGTEKAACRWALDLKRRGHDVSAISLADGPRHSSLREAGIPLTIAPSEAHPRASRLSAIIRDIDPDVIHTHAPGYPHEGDVLYEALASLNKKYPIVQTNIFGKLLNPADERFVKFRLFISWTSCLQAARRSHRALDAKFFRRQSVAVYPVDDPLAEKVESEHLKAESPVFRRSLGLSPDDVLFGRFARPDRTKWTDLPVAGFALACAGRPKLKLLLREPPPQVAASIRNSSIRKQIIILAATSDPQELTLSQMACDAVLHASSFGESFGYGIAEPMALGKPVIANSTPWADQAQVELVRHGECGFLASSPDSVQAAILKIAANPELRLKLGQAARKHILSLADPNQSTDRVETALKCAVNNIDNPLVEKDLTHVHQTRAFLRRHQWGHSPREILRLTTLTTRLTFSRFVKRKILPALFPATAK